MSKKRRNHSPEFKLKVALAAIKGDQRYVGLIEEAQEIIERWERENINESLSDLRVNYL